MEHLKPLHYSRLRDILEREDEHGEHIPVSISYACLNGAVVDIQEKICICIGVDPRHRRRTLKFIGSNEIRTVHDCLILRVNDSRIIVS